MGRSGQTTIESILLLGVVLLVALAAYSLIFQGPNSADAKIAASRAYWSSSAYPIRLGEWALTGAYDGSIPACEANLTVVAKNAMGERITLRKIGIAQGDFEHVWFSDGAYAGHSDSPAIVLNPGDSATLIIQHYQNGTGLYVPTDLYELDMSFTYDRKGIASISQAGTIPVVGRRGEFNENATLDLYCAGGTAQCPAGSSSCCAPANCINGVCRANLCSGVACDVPNCEVCNPITGSCYCLAATAPPAYYCGADSKCHLREQRNCSDGLEGFNSSTMLCIDNCPGGYFCDSDCTCSDECPFWRVCGASGEICCGPNQKCNEGNECEDCPPGTVACGSYCCPEGDEKIMCDVSSPPAACTLCCSDETFNCNNSYCCSPDQLCTEGACVQTTCSSGEIACPLDDEGSTFECCTSGEVCNTNSSSRGCISESSCSWLPLCGESFCCAESQSCYDGQCVDEMPEVILCDWGLVCPAEDLCFMVNQSSGEPIGSGTCCAATATCANATGTCCAEGQVVCENDALGITTGTCCPEGETCSQDSQSGQYVCCGSDAYLFEQRISRTQSYPFYLSSSCPLMCCEDAVPSTSFCIPPSSWNQEGAICCSQTQICLTGTPSPDVWDMNWECCAESTSCANLPNPGDLNLDGSINPADWSGYTELQLDALYGEQTYLCCEEPRQCTVPSIGGVPSYSCCPSDFTCLNGALCCEGDPNAPPGSEAAGKYCKGIQPGATAYCCGPGQECKEIYYSSEYNTYACCEESKYLLSDQLCCPNEVTSCVSDGTEPDPLCQIYDTPVDGGEGIGYICNQAGCKADCCPAGQLQCGIGGGLGVGECTIGPVCGDLTSRGCGVDEGDGCVVLKPTCQISCEIDACAVKCGNNQCCESTETCLQRPAPYNDEICCDETCREANNLKQTNDGFCCDEYRAVSDGAGGYTQCCEYGSVAYKDVNTGNWGCCSGAAVPIVRGQPESVCCEGNDYEPCDVGGGVYECCLDNHCNDATQACCAGSVCNGVVGGCCSSEAPVCYKDVDTDENACCAANKLCTTLSGTDCCALDESCMDLYGPGGSPLGDACCTAAEVCGFGCCAPGSTCVNGQCT